MKQVTTAKSTIRKRIWVAFGLILTILSVTFLIYSWQFQRINNRISQLLDIQETKQQAVSEMKFYTSNIARFTSSYLIEKDQSHLEKIRSSETSFEMNLTEFIKLNQTEEQKSLGKEIQILYEDLKVITNEVTDLHIQRETSTISFREGIEEINSSTNEMYQANIHNDSQEATEKLKIVVAMLSIINEISITIETYTPGLDTNSQQQILDLQDDFSMLVTEYRKTSLTAYENSWLTHIDDEFNQVITYGIEALTISNTFYDTLDQFDKSLQKIEVFLDSQVFPLIQAEVLAASVNVRGSSSSTGIWILVLVLIGIAVGITGVFILSRELTGPITNLIKGAEIVESGRINYRFNTSIKGEFGQLAVSFNKMLNNLGRLHEMLEESEEQAWALLDVTSDEVIMIDLRGAILASNESAALRFEMSIEQMINESYYDLLPAELSASMRVRITEAIRLKKPVHYEDEWDGKIIDRNILPIFGQQKEVTRIAIFSRDVTVHKWVEDVAEQLGRRNALILNAAGEGIYGLDTQGITTFVNPAAARMLGYQPEELVGKRHHELVHYSKPDGKPYPPEQCPIYMAFKDGVIHTNVDDEVFWQKDGTPFPVEYTSTPIIVDDKILGAVVTFRDITDRKRIEEMLHQSEEKYRSIVESATSLIISVDQEGLIIDCNTRVQQILDYSRDEIIGKPLITFIHPDEHSNTMNLLKEVLSTGFEYDNHNRMILKNGSFINVIINTAVVKDEKGDYIQTVFMINKITQQT